MGLWKRISSWWEKDTLERAGEDSLLDTESREREGDAEREHALERRLHGTGPGSPLADYERDSEDPPR